MTRMEPITYSWFAHEENWAGISMLLDWVMSHRNMERTLVGSITSYNPQNRIQHILLITQIHHHQPINDPTAGTGLSYELHIRRTSHNPPRGLVFQNFIYVSMLD
jgi:hypothetical protein